MSFRQAVADLPLDLKVIVHTTGGQVFMGEIDETASADTLVLAVQHRKKLCYINTRYIEAISWGVGE